MRSQNIGKTGLGRRRHAFAAAALAENVAVRADQPEPETARAPIHRDISGISSSENASIDNHGLRSHRGRAVGCKKQTRADDRVGMQDLLEALPL